jgi:membrane protein
VKTLGVEGHISFRELARRVWYEIDKDDVAGLAAQMSYWFVLALFPFLIFLAALVGTLPFTGLWDKLLVWITHYLPPASQRLIFQTVAALTDNRTGFLSFGVLGTAWAASSGITSLAEALNAVYELKETRSYLKRRIIALAMVLVLSASFIVAFALMTAGGRLGKRIAAPFLPVDLHANLVWSAGWWVVSMFLIALCISFLDYSLPNLKRSWTWLTPGGVFVALAWIPALLGFDLYVRYVASYNKTYGALGALVILMVWVYVTSLIILVGAEVNSELRKLKEEFGSEQERHIQRRTLAPAGDDRVSRAQSDRVSGPSDS